jgi:hypothetical protein
LVSSHLLTSLLANLGRYTLLAVLLARIAVPAGFMPGDTSHGWFLQLCPEGLAPATVIVLVGKHHNHDGNHPIDDLPDYDNDCLLSGLSLVALPAAGIDLLGPTWAIDSIPTPPTPTALATAATVYRSRAPPIA